MTQTEMTETGMTASEMQSECEFLIASGQTKESLKTLMQDYLNAAIHYCDNHKYDFTFYADRWAREPDHFLEHIDHGFTEAARMMWACLHGDADAFASVLVELESRTEHPCTLFFETGLLDRFPDAIWTRYHSELRALCEEDAPH